MRLSGLLAAVVMVLVGASNAKAQDLENPYENPPAEAPPPPPEAPPEQPQAPPLPAYAPLKLVGIMIESQQALFWDEQANEYKLGKLGGEVAGWRIVALQQDKVVLTFGDARDEIPLTPAPTFYKHVPSPRRVPPVIIVAPPPQPAAPGRAVPAPEAPPPVAAPPVAAPPVVTAPPPAVVTPPPAPAPKPAKPIEERRRIARAELDRELNDFDRLMQTVTLAPADGGGYRIVAIEPKSWLASLGFKTGDTVRSVNGSRIDTVDDAARVYARVLTSKTFVVEVDRGSDKVLLRFDVR